MLLRALFLVAVAILPVASGNSYWVDYEGDAPASCLADLGMPVDETCCTNKAPLPFITNFYGSTCFVIKGLLPDGLGLQSYLGCDDGEPVYGEACYNNGENGGVIPANETVEDFNATDIGECGCTFQVSGVGCHKIRDFSSLPGFETDTRQVFIMLNETCDDADNSTTPTTPEPGDNSTMPTAAPPTSGTANKPVVVLAVLAAAAMFVVV